MKSKVLVGILLFALMTVCIIAGGLGFMLWQQRQATAAAPVAQAAEPDPALLKDAVDCAVGLDATLLAKVVSGNAFVNEAAPSTR